MLIVGISTYKLVSTIATTLFIPFKNWKEQRDKKITVIKFVDVHKPTTAANPKATRAGRSSELSHCFKSKREEENNKPDIKKKDQN